MGTLILSSLLVSDGYFTSKWEYLTSKGYYQQIDINIVYNLDIPIDTANPITSLLVSMGISTFTSKDFVIFCRVSFRLAMSQQ